ncbi:MAG: FHA domain-containing protein [Chloroflexi bacterium]|nr:FHA domain-containing protein [Chloroflexota bacterium]
MKPGGEEGGVLYTMEQPLLEVHGGATDGSIVPIAKQTITIGRLPENDVSVNEVGISRKHAAIVHTDEGYSLRDLNSTNGTFVNQEKIGDEGYLLRDGDEVRLANSGVSLLFRDFLSRTVSVTMVQPSVESDSPQPEESADAADDEEVFEGNVRLSVQADGDIQLVVNFVQELRLQAEFRLLRMVGHSQKNVDILLGLREPLRLRETLGRMQGVSEVNEMKEEAEGRASSDREQGSEGSERMVNVLLRSDQS